MYIFLFKLNVVKTSKLNWLQNRGGGIGESRRHAIIERF